MLLIVFVLNEATACGHVDEMTERCNMDLLIHVWQEQVFS